jgi:undecaprenyl phosphate N,N'-diacetylbacillosamine 1-phosphate transferase
MLKTLFDVTLSSVLLVALAPVMALEAIAIALDFRGPVLFVQERIGRGGRPFRIYKFRTMILPEHSLDPDGKLKSDAERITRLGRFLRRTSLDELPQLFNILKGDMSFVGPRPTLAYQVERYDAFQRRRLEVKPGVTGLAQIRGRNGLTWEEKIRHDVEYVERGSFLMDLRILIATARVVVKKNDIEFVKDDRISRLD